MKFSKKFQLISEIFDIPTQINKITLDSMHLSFNNLLTNIPKNTNIQTRKNSKRNPDSYQRFFLKPSPVHLHNRENSLVMSANKQSRPEGLPSIVTSNVGETYIKKVF